MALQPGERLGPYEIQALLGAGGMGEVYRGRDTRLGREVAIKVLPDRLAGDPNALARFEREAKAVAALSHPNILAIHDFGQDRGIHFAVTELLDGETLRQRLNREQPSWRKAVEIASAIADGLAAAHARRIVHRDLKPDNVFLTSGGLVKILDFGLARFEGDAPPTGHLTSVPTETIATEAGTILGTVEYMSPEQVSGETADARSDIFAFGCVLYEMLSGRRAFGGRSPGQTMAAILRDQPAEISQPGVERPIGLDRIVARCLEKTPNERFQTARDLGFALKETSGTSTMGPPAAAASTGPGSPLPLRSNRRSVALWAMALAVAVVAAAALLLRPDWRPGLSQPTGAAAIRSLAVLPFENGSKDMDAEYLGDGLTESLINQMSRVPSLKVMARATVFRFKGSADPQEVGRKLGVGAILTGTVSRRGQQLSISAELVEISTGARLWGDTYNRPLADLLRVQDEIASDISDGLRLRLTEPQKHAVGRQGTENPQAYELYPKGRYFAIKDTEEGYLDARRLFLQAIQQDPGFAEAHLELADTYGLMAVGGYARPAEAWPQSDEEARRALSLEPGFPRARASLAGRRFWFDRDWTGAERELRELSAAGQLGVASRLFAILLWATGRTDEAGAVMEKARRDDPGNLILTIARADYLAQSGRLEEANELYRAATVSDPSDPRPLFGLAEMLRRRGDARSAIDALKKAFEMAGEEEGVKVLAAAHTERDYENAEVAVARLRLAELQSLAKQRYISPLDLARLYAQVGQREKAFSSLDSALTERSAGLVLLKVDRAWDRIRDDPRFSNLIRRIGIP